MISPWFEILHRLRNKSNLFFSSPIDEQPTFGLGFEPSEFRRSFSNMSKFSFESLIGQSLIGFPVLASLLLGAGLSNAIADSEKWNHAALVSRNGVAIQLDYQTVSSGPDSNGFSATVASPVWITVSYPAFTGQEKIRVVFLNFFKISGMAPNDMKSEQYLDLNYVGDGRFTGCLREPVSLFEGRIGYGYNFRQELAVVVSGTWLQTHETSSNFRLDLGW